ncbi:MAG: Hpt domain-containing protein [Sphingobium sp.]|nr:Hpt domain-containing protein [Sphingobium sp.]|tara:strand:- start:903 stop:1217 length:315 start_codon:yes stop_codon:yes gene_type:complete
MSYDPGALDAALAAAVGDDSALIADLRIAFMESAARQVDLLARARCDANWALAAWRLKGLAASFGLMTLMALADEAAEAAPGDPRILRRLRSALAALERDIPHS